MDENQRPKVYEYLNAVSFLRDYYDYRKKTDPRFSYEKWSKELGLTSRSFLRLVVTGQKKMSANFIEAFSQQCFLDKTEADYFLKLCHYSKAKNQKERDLFGKELIRSLRGQTQQCSIEPSPDFISDPLLPRILTVLAFEDLQATAQLISQLMGKDVQTIEESLLVLSRLQLASAEDLDGKTVWKTTKKNFKVSSDKGNSALMKFHEKCLQDAMTAFEQPKEDRRYDSVLLPLSAQELTDFNKALDEFIAEQIHRFSHKTYSSRRLFQINVNAHAVTQMVESIDLD